MGIRWTENDHVRVCLKWHNAEGFPAWRQNAGGVPTGSYRMRLAPKGAADITGILPDGRRLEVECKLPGRKQSPSQREFEQLIADCGGVYLCVHSLDELMDQMGKVINGKGG